MKSNWEWDLQLFSTPIEEEEEIDESALGDEEAPAGEETPGAEIEGEEEDMPDHLLSESELAERQRERAAASAVEGEPSRRLPDEERGAIGSQLREIFTNIARETAPAQPTEPERGAVRQPAELQPFTLSEEQAEKITAKILEQPGGIAKAIAWAVNFGDRRATARIAGSAEGQAALQSSGESFADRYVARKLRDPGTKFGKAVEPVFQSILEGFNLAELTSMTKEARDSWFDEQWERATGRALLKKSGVKPAPSAGVGRGAGTRPGAPGRGRVVVKMTESQKQQVYKSLPNTEDGRRKAERQIWEIEHGTTSDPKVRAMTRESMRFSEAVGFGG